MATKQKFKLDQNRDDDFGVYLAQLHANDKGAQKKEANEYREQSKRLLDKRKKAK